MSSAISSSSSSLDIAAVMLSTSSWLVSAVAAVLLLLASIRVWSDGFVDFAVESVRRLPPVRRLLASFLRRQVRDLVAKDFGVVTGDGDAALMCIPMNGVSASSLSSEIQSLKTPQTDRMFAYVYSEADDVLSQALKQLQHEASDEFLQRPEEAHSEEQRQLGQEFARAFMHENALNPALFKSLRKFEVELVQMTASMLHADAAARGNVTSGGTESILMAVKCYRDLARRLRPSVHRPNIVAASTVHPAFNKAAHYFNLEMVLVPVEAGSFRADGEKLRAAIDGNTILIVASAPQYCHGVVDDVPAYAAIAQQFGLPLHVDACFGGFMLPWVEKLGYPVPKFDFRVAGVTSISADLHKYGFAPKGASVIIYRNADLRQHQLFAFSSWPGGLFGSPTMAGTRPGGHLAAAWATVRMLGQRGYLRVAEQLMELTQFWILSIRGLEPLEILGSPHMTCFAIGSSDQNLVNVFLLADVMEEKGWKMEREMNPDCLHVTVMPHHLKLKEQFVQDLNDSVEKIKTERMKAKGLAAVYGMVARVPAKALIDDFLIEFFNQIYS